MLIRVPSLNDDILNVLLITKESEFTVTDAKKRKRTPKKKKKHFHISEVETRDFEFIKKNKLKTKSQATKMSATHFIGQWVTGELNFFSSTLHLEELFLCV